MTTTQTTFEQKALESIGYSGKTVPAGTAGHDVSEFAIGEVVWIHSRGGWRLAIVTGTKKSRIETIYTTEGSVTESLAIYDRYHQQYARNPQGVENAAVAAGAQAGRNYDYYAQVATGTYRITGANGRDLGTPSEADVERARAIVHAWTREEYVAGHVADRRDSIRRECEVSPTGRVTYTRKAIPAVEAIKR